MRRSVSRCRVCGRKCRRYDAGRGRRRWRGLDLGFTMVVVEAEAPRVVCARHGVLVAALPWARPGSWFTRDFEDQVTWLTLHACRSVVAELMRVDWKTVGAIVARVEQDLSARSAPRLDNLVNIGIDETSYKKGHKYMTLVVDHDTNRVVWAAKGFGREVLEGFFALLGPERAQRIRCVTADGAGWISDCVGVHCPDAVRAMDPFHTVGWVTEALDEVRRDLWRQARKTPGPKRGPGRPSKTGPVAPEPAKTVKNARWALLKNPERLTEYQRARLEQISVDSPVLHRAWRMKEHFRLALKLPIDEAEAALKSWLAWAQRCRIPVFVELQRKIKRHLQAILNTIRMGLTNARIEAINNKIKVTIRMGYGFRNTDNLIALIMLKCGGLKPPLPGRN